MSKSAIKTKFEAHSRRAREIIESVRYNLESSHNAALHEKYFVKNCFIKLLDNVYRYLINSRIKILQTVEKNSVNLKLNIKLNRSDFARKFISEFQRIFTKKFQI